jgi:IS5 family transposase
MRQRFEQQLNFFATPISELKFTMRSRDELPPVLRSLQYLFVTPELNTRIFKLVEEKICSGKKKTGRKGMDLWHILVLATIRQNLDIDWDRLHALANYDVLTRSVLGVPVLDEKYMYSRQSILDNVSLLDEALLADINKIVIEAGDNLLKKKMSRLY